MIRITSGIVKNKKLKAPKIEGFRAVQEIAKLAVFSIIGDNIVNSECLDLFSGSGNLGLEALSRGAKFCDFVDENYTSIGIINDNIKNCGFEEVSEVHKANAVKYAGNTHKTYDYIFLDPFYSDTSHTFLMTNLEEILNDNGKIIFFHGDNLDIQKIIKDTKLQIETTRRFGKSYFTILKH